MKPLYFLLLLLFLTSCYNIERNCSDYKVGTFEFNYTIDGVEKTGKFMRTDSLNIDYYEGKVDSSTVRWINDCEFILKKINPNSMSEKEAIHMKILSTTNNSYTFEYKLAIKKSNSELRVEKGIAKKIN
ncbi:hypothetical protein H8K90_07420 [Winogradskyella echinorum]|uniref:DNA topoisomerase IV n=1 Tax=Winogradskyella echinorum TaxID=538189 RepID=A0ABR6Y0D5_9FLAO|nr:hypothetical protein [Winogradskyella echinorum]MBC3846202.1 hypothetical protein [Winogradskyella echinorum]MBC5750550.1 hypothetical protein [Winogradskyella echinorum]